MLTFQEIENNIELSRKQVDICPKARFEKEK